MASSYKFCVIANGEYDIYAAQERANEWDYAAGHAIAQNAGCLLYTSPSPRDGLLSRMPSSA